MGSKTERYDYPDVVRSGGAAYRPTAAGRRRPDGEWEGWIEFVEMAGVKRVATDIETTQPNADAFRYWVDGIGVAYLEGALTRALQRQTSSASKATPHSRAPSVHDLLDPFEVHAQGERLLEDQLEALDTDHVRNIVRDHELASPESSESLSRSELIAAILAAVRRKDRQSTPETLRQNKGGKE